MKRLLLLYYIVWLTASHVSAQINGPKESPYVSGDVIVQLTENASIRPLLERAPDHYKMRFGKVISAPMRLSLVHFDHDAVSHDRMIFWLYSQPEVSIAQNNHYVQMRSTVPNDNDFDQQWHHVNNGTSQQGNGTPDADIDSDEAWDITTGGTTAHGDDIVVCLIESANLDHSDLDPNRWFNSAEIPDNGQDDDGNGYIDDYHGWNPVQNNDNYGSGGHGTNCLGMIGAKGNNNSLVVGANWNVKLMVIGDYSISTESNAIEAYTYPLVMRQIWNNTNGASGAFVVATSSSWGIDGGDPNTIPAWCAFYDTMGVYGIINVGATTNQNLNVDLAGDIPTACASNYMLGVGRTDNNDNTAGGYGVTTIELGAPGINVVTTAGSSGTTTTTGTSFSCPLTAGVIGLAYSIPCSDFMDAVKANPQAGADLVLNALLAGVDQKPQLATRFVTGGRLNARGTLDELMAQACSGTICLPPSNISTNNIVSNSADISFTPNGGATGTNLYWRSVGGNWAEVQNITSPHALTNLNGCTEYEYYIQSLCGVDSSSQTSIRTFRTLECGNCIDLAYCSHAASDAFDEWIASFSIDAYTNNSGNDNGYGDFTSAGSISLETNNTYNVIIEPGWAGVLYDEYSRIWIDLNQSGFFEANELVFDQGSASQTTVTGSVTIPASATVGITRMRVQMAYLGQGQLTLPPICDGFMWGEVEDYCLLLWDQSTASLDLKEPTTVTVYPNPTSGQVNFEVTDPSASSIRITDITGRVIREIEVFDELTIVDLGKQSIGTYFYVVSNGQGQVIATDKLVLTK